MVISRKPKHILDAYRFPFFRPLEKIRGIFGDSKARIITLVRRSKKQSATPVVGLNLVGTTRSFDKFATSPVATHEFIWRSRFDGCCVCTAQR
jgi:hypothetical protein